MTACLVPELTPGKTPVEMVTQPHGGALRRGGTNKGGTGRPSNLIRKLALRKLPESVEVLGMIQRGVRVEFDDEGKTRLVAVNDAARVSAAKVLGDFAGLTQAANMLDIRERLKLQIGIIRSHPGVTPELAESLLHALSGVWK